MTNSPPTFDYPATLQEYAVNETEYLRQHPEYHVLCTGAVVFDKTGKLLLVQRAADEKAFPNLWVRVALQDALNLNAIPQSIHTTSRLTSRRRYQAAK
jgi:isopentenyldiphosphate isomerase